MVPTALRPPFCRSAICRFTSSDRIPLAAAVLRELVVGNNEEAQENELSDGKFAAVNGALGTL